MGKHKRCVFFVRHLAKVPRSTFTAYPGCIVIAAGGLKPVDADASLFSFEDVFRYDANGLALDLEAVTLRFEEWAAASKPPLKPNKAMLAKMKSLANHLKNIAVGFMRARRSGTENAYAQVAKDMAKVTMSSLENFFASDDAPCKISFAQRPARVSFWAEVCRRTIRQRRSLLAQNLQRMDVLEAVSAVCTKKFGNKINQVDGIGASQVYMKIVKFQPQEMRGLYIFPHVVDLVNHDEHYIHATLINWPDYDMLCSNSLGERDDGILLQEVMASTD